MDKWIYYQKRDDLYVAKVFHNKTEYYIGGFKKKEDAIAARDRAIEDIINQGKLDKYKSRSNSKSRRQSANLNLDANSSFMEEPEYRLRYAVLMCAINDVCGSPEHPEYAKSRNWILGKTQSPASFSFDEICELFHLNPIAVREKVINIDEQTKEKLRTAIQ